MEDNGKRESEKKPSKTTNSYKKNSEQNISHEIERYENK